jgi:hypothetical protein
MNTTPTTSTSLALFNDMGSISHLHQSDRVMTNVQPSNIGKGMTESEDSKWILALEQPEEGFTWEHFSRDFQLDDDHLDELVTVCNAMLRRLKVFFCYIMQSCNGQSHLWDVHFLSVNLPHFVPNKSADCAFGSTPRKAHPMEVKLKFDMVNSLMKAQSHKEKVRNLYFIGTVVMHVLAQCFMRTDRARDTPSRLAIEGHSGYKAEFELNEGKIARVLDEDGHCMDLVRRDFRSSNSSPFKPSYNRRYSRKDLRIWLDTIMSTGKHEDQNPKAVFEESDLQGGESIEKEAADAPDAVIIIPLGPKTTLKPGNFIEELECGTK